MISAPQQMQELRIVSDSQGTNRPLMREFVMSAISTSPSIAELMLEDGDPLSIPLGTSWHLDVLVVARGTAGAGINETWANQFRCSVGNTMGVIGMFGQTFQSPYSSGIHAASASISLTTGGGLFNIFANGFSGVGSVANFAALVRMIQVGM